MGCWIVASRRTARLRGELESARVDRGWAVLAARKLIVSWADEKRRPPFGGNYCQMAKGSKCTLEVNDSSEPVDRWLA